MSSWPVANPAMVLVALGAMGVPVLIHLLNRRRYRRVEWAAMRFLESAMRQRARRMRFEQWLLLLMRMVVIGLFGLALARPFLPLSAMASVAGSRTYRVILLDNSLSMSAVDASGTSRFLAAKDAVRSVVERADAGDAVCLVTMGGAATAVTAHEAYDRRLVLDRLSALGVTEAGTDVVGGLRLAREVLEGSGFVTGQREVVVVSDFAGEAWGIDADQAERRGAIRDAMQRLAKSAAVRLIDAGVDDMANLSVSGFVEVGSTPAATDLPVQLAVTVTQHGGEGDGAGSVDVFAGDRLVRRLVFEDVGRGTSKTQRFALSAGDVAGRVLMARLRPATGDAIEADNARYLLAGKADAVRVLVVDDELGFGRGGGASRYVTAALHPGGSRDGGSGFAVTVVTTEQMSNEVLSGYDTIVLSAVRGLDAVVWDALGRYVERGGAILVAGSESLDAANLNASGLMPGHVGEPWGRASESARAVSFSDVAPVNAVLGDFAAHPGTGLFSARIWKYLTIEPADDADVWLRFDDEAAAIVSRRVGAGAVCFLATSLDMSWNNLPAKGDYVALLVSLVGHLARVGDVNRSLIVGDTFVKGVSQREAVRGATVQTPTREDDGARTRQGARGAELLYGPISAAGRYSAQLGDRSIVFVANVPADESDTTGLNESGIADLAQCPHAYVQVGEEWGGVARSQSPTHELAGLLLGAVTILLVGETWLASRLGAVR